METMDWMKICAMFDQDIKKLSYENNKHLFTKVAFDVFQLNSSPIESLWVLEDGEDGKKYLSAQYLEEDGPGIEIKSNWEALSDGAKKNITLLYKGSPIQRFASADYNFSKDDIHLFQKMLIEKLSTDTTFVRKLIQSQTEDRKKILFVQFPDLAKV